MRVRADASAPDLCGPLGVTNRGAIAESIESDVDGLLVPAEDPGSLPSLRRVIRL